MAGSDLRLGITFYRFLISKTLAAISFSLFLIFLMWSIVEQYKTSDPGIAVFLAGMVPVIYLLVMLVSAIPIGHSIDRINNSVLGMVSAGIMAAGFALFATGFSIYTVYVTTAIVATGVTLNGDTFAAMIKKLVSNDGITRATSYNTISNSTSSLIGVGMGGAALILFSYYAPYILISLAVGSMLFAFPKKMGLSGIASKSMGPGKGYHEVLKFYRTIIGFTVLALIINGFFVSIEVYSSGLFNIYLHSTPLYYTLFDASFPAAMFAGTYLTNHYETFFDRPGVIAVILVVYAPILIVLGLSRSTYIDISAAGLLGLINPMVNIPLVSRLTKFTPVEIFGRVMAFLRIFIQSSTPVMAAVYSFASLFFQVPQILLALGILMLPVSALGLQVVRVFYSKTEIAAEPA